jgi:DNA polymerase III epsilon subunit-like protein
LEVNTNNLLAETNDYPLSIAAFLYDMDKIGETFELMKVEPDSMLACYFNYGIDNKPDAQRINGITREKLDTFGLSPHEILPLFAEFLDKADRIVGHNVKYDADIMRIAFARAGWEGDPFEGRDLYCTCREARTVCKIPKYRMDHAEDWKLPKLIEAYKFFFGDGFNGAHGAVNDTKAAFDVYLALQGKKAKVQG